MIGSGSYEDHAPGTVNISCNQNLRTKDQGLSSFYPSCISSLPCSNSVHGHWTVCDALPQNTSLHVQQTNNRCDVGKSKPRTVLGAAGIGEKQEEEEEVEEKVEEWEEDEKEEQEEEQEEKQEEEQDEEELLQTSGLRGAAAVHIAALKPTAEQLLFPPNQK